MEMERTPKESLEYVRKFLKDAETAEAHVLYDGFPHHDLRQIIEMDEYSPQREAIFKQSSEWFEKNMGKCAIVLENGTIKVFESPEHERKYGIENNISLSDRMMFFL